MPRKIKPNHKEKLVELDGDILKALQRLAIESPQGNVKNYMESILTTFAMRDELRNLYEHCDKDEQQRKLFMEHNKGEIIAIRDLQPN